MIEKENKPRENKLNTTNYKIINYHQLLPAIQSHVNILQ